MATRLATALSPPAARGPRRPAGRRAGPVDSAPVTCLATGVRRRVTLPPRSSVRLTLLAWAPMLFWYAAVRPGLLSADSLLVWGQVVFGHWVDYHPPLYTAAVWVSAHLVHGPDLVTLGQSLLLVASIVSMTRATRRLGSPLAAVAAAAAVLVVSPMLGLFAMSLWKDVPYTAAVVFASARIVDLTRLRLAGEPADPEVLRSLAFWLVLATLLRQNGILFAAVVLAVLGAVLREQRGAVLRAGAVVVLSLVLSKSVVYPLLGVSRPPPRTSISMLLNDLAWVARTDPSAFDAGDRALLGRVAPFETWRQAPASFGCTSANWQFMPVFDWVEVDDRVGDYVRLWFDILRKRPGRVLGNHVCIASIAWRPDTVGSMYTVSGGIDPNPYGLATHPLVAGLDDVARRAAAATHGVQWLTWRGATWIYAGWAALAVAAVRRRRPAVLLAGLAGLALPLAVFPLNPAQDARYMLGGIVIGVLLLPLAALPARPGPPPGEGPPTTQSVGRQEALESAAARESPP